MSTPKAPDPVNTLKSIGDTAAAIAKNVEWEGADDLAKKLRDLGTAVANFPKPEQEEAADELVKMMQDLGDAVADLAKRAKGQANAAEAERDNAKKETTRAKAREAAAGAQNYRDAANGQAQWADAVAVAVVLASGVVKDRRRTQNAQSVATKVGVDARAAMQYAERAWNAVEAAERIADTA